jgi:hypothetical protein
MINQNYFGPVGQVAGGSIVNQHDHESIEERRHRLIESQRQHGFLRDIADRRLRRHPCRWIAPLAFFAVAATALYEVRHLGAVSSLWPVQLALLVIGGSTLMVFEHVRRECRAEWKHHNDAVIAINHALHVL